MGRPWGSWLGGLFEEVGLFGGCVDKGWGGLSLMAS